MLPEACQDPGCQGVYAFDLVSSSAAMWASERCAFHAAGDGQLLTWVTEEATAAAEADAARVAAKEAAARAAREAAAAAAAEVAAADDAAEGEAAGVEAAAPAADTSAAAVAAASGAEDEAINVDEAAEEPQAKQPLPVAACVEPRLFVVLPSGKWHVGWHPVLPEGMGSWCRIGAWGMLTVWQLCSKLGVLSVLLANACPFVSAGDGYELLGAHAYEAYSRQAAAYPGCTVSTQELAGAPEPGTQCHSFLTAHAVARRELRQLAAPAPAAALPYDPAAAAAGAMHSLRRPSAFPARYQHPASQLLLPRGVGVGGVEQPGASYTSASGPGAGTRIISVREVQELPSLDVTAAHRVLETWQAESAKLSHAQAATHAGGRVAAAEATAAAATSAAGGPATEEEAAEISAAIQRAIELRCACA